MAGCCPTSTAAMANWRLATRAQANAKKPLASVLPQRWCATDGFVVPGLVAKEKSHASRRVGMPVQRCHPSSTILPRIVPVSTKRCASRRLAALMRPST